MKPIYTKPLPTNRTQRAQASPRILITNINPVMAAKRSGIVVGGCATIRSAMGAMVKMWRDR